MNKNYKNYQPMEIGGDICDLIDKGVVCDVIEFLYKHRKYLKRNGDVASDMLDDYIYGDEGGPSNTTAWLPVIGLMGAIIHTD